MYLPKEGNNENGCYVFSRALISLRYKKRHSKLSVLQLNLDFTIKIAHEKWSNLFSLITKQLFNFFNM